MNEKQVLKAVGVALLAAAFLAVLVGVVVWPQPGEVKAVAAAVVLAVGAFVALVST